MKAAASRKEPAWDSAGTSVGLLIWRIEKFHVVPWPKEKYGELTVGNSPTCPAPHPSIITERIVVVVVVVAVSLRVVENEKNKKRRKRRSGGILRVLYLLVLFLLFLRLTAMTTIVMTFW